MRRRPAVPGGGDELAAVERLTGRLGTGRAGEVWLGDDAAVLSGEGGPLLLATDLVVEGVHFDRRLSSLADVGWKVLTANVSDAAAMGGRARRAVVAVAGAFGDELEALYDGLCAASEAYGCPVVGGDLSDAGPGGGLVVAVTVLGTTDGRPAVRRSGGRPGDRVYVTGPLGAAAAGLRRLQAGEADVPAHLVAAHRRPVARAAEGVAAATAGARAMLDVSDGLGIDLDRLCRASGVGAELDQVPVAEGATQAEALGGGEDFELLVAVPAEVDLAARFAASGLRPPLELGVLVAGRGRRLLRGEPLAADGYRHGRRPSG